MHTKYILVALVLLFIATIVGSILLRPQSSDSPTLPLSDKPTKDSQKKNTAGNISPTNSTSQSTSPKPHITVQVGEIIPEQIKKQASQNTSIKSYSHSQLSYTIQYPSQWKVETVDAPYEEYDGYFDVRLYPEGGQTRVTQYQSTPEIIIRAEDTEKNLQTYFEEDPLGKQYAEKIQNTSIASVPAIIYDWSFDPTVRQTTAVFVLKGVAYKIQLSWINEEQKKSALDEFALIYQSFSK